MLLKRLSVTDRAPLTVGPNRTLIKQVPSSGSVPRSRQTFNKDGNVDLLFRAAGNTVLGEVRIERIQTSRPRHCIKVRGDSPDYFIVDHKNPDVCNFFTHLFSLSAISTVSFSWAAAMWIDPLTIAQPEW
jgi:hypothetical protein